MVIATSNELYLLIGAALWSCTWSVLIHLGFYNLEHLVDVGMPVKADNLIEITLREGTFAR